MPAKKRNIPKKTSNPRSRKTSASRGSAARSTQRWSAHVTETSDALDLKHHLFEKNDPSEIAQSLKRSAERSRRRKGTPFQSAMSMLNFYINRAGKNLPASRIKTLNRTKDELRKAFGRAS